MEISNFIVLLVGKSGTGKSTVELLSQSKYGFIPLKSYTTRPPRYEGEDTHTFVGEKEYKKMRDDMCALTVFDGYKYWATNEQVDKSDIYVIDPPGIEYFRRAYKGDKHIITVELYAKALTRFKRMKERGDSTIDALRRLAHDKKVFANIDADIRINADVNNPYSVTEHLFTAVNLSAMLADSAKKGSKK